jgi:hypothetical protein
MSLNLDVSEQLERKVTTKQCDSMWVTIQRKTDWKWDSNDDELDGKRV